MPNPCSNCGQEKAREGSVICKRCESVAAGLPRAFQNHVIRYGELLVKASKDGAAACDCGAVKIGTAVVHAPNCTKAMDAQISKWKARSAKL